MFDVKIRYDTEKLKKTVKDLSSVTGLTIAIKDLGNNYLCTAYPEGDSFCACIQSVDEGRFKCQCSDDSMESVCLRERKPYSHVCHAGLIDTTVPILRKDVVVGFVIIGRVRPGQDFSEISHLLSWMPNDRFSELEKCYECLSYFTKEQLESLVSLVSGLVFEDAIEVEFDSDVERIADYIDNNLGESLTLECLCRRFFVSKNYLYRCFSLKFGMTVGEYISSKRLSLAADMLKNSKDSARAVAETVGYPNYTHFTKVFKKRMGMTPTEYRAGESQLTLDKT